MGNANYRKGSDFEREYIRLKTAQGFSCTRTAGSHSEIDVICLPLATDGGVAWPASEVLACQLKRHGGTKPKPTKEFMTLCFFAGQVKKLWVTKRDRGEIVEETVI